MKIKNFYYYQNGAEEKQQFNESTVTNFIYLFICFLYILKRIYTVSLQLTVKLNCFSQSNEFRKKGQKR